MANMLMPNTLIENDYKIVKFNPNLSHRDTEIPKDTSLNTTTEPETYSLGAIISFSPLKASTETLINGKPTCNVGDMFDMMNDWSLNGSSLSCEDYHYVTLGSAYLSDGTPQFHVSMGFEDARNPKKGFHITFALNDGMHKSVSFYEDTLSGLSEKNWVLTQQLDAQHTMRMVPYNTGKRTQLFRTMRTGEVSTMCFQLVIEKTE